MTIHTDAARAVLDRLIETPEGMRVMHDTHQCLRDGRWSGRYIDSIGQHGSATRSDWPMPQVAAFARVHGLIAAGAVAMVSVDTDGPPEPDKRREANARTLSGLPHPFVAKVDIGQTNSTRGDGVLRWTEPIRVSVATGLIETAEGTEWSGPISLHYHGLPPGEAPLEVGSSLPSRTLLHLIEDGKVARWPYGHSELRLFINLEHVGGRHLDPNPRHQETA